ncbi:hypothetical protein CYY_010465 [Polysphondylium violaceum]|uniref:Uncharacterized protein n=1 Tax=Polysphondylium violaceum TaxID=133409 RepID=A0A8J4PL98_9MYCE|nr:hypothetical protein CYY_010465 [Polysphondylium violaceum]
MNTDHLLQHKKDLETLTQLLSNNNNSTTTNNNNNNNNSIISNSLITQQSFNYVSSELILDDGEDDDDDDDFSGEGCCDFDDHYDEELLDTNPTIPPSIVSNIQENQKLKTSTTTTTTNSNSNNNTNPISRKLNSILESSIATNPPNTKKVKYSYNDFIEATDLNKDNLDPEKLELLKINEEYQNIIQKYIKQIEYAKARNAYLLVNILIHRDIYILD